MGVPDWRGCLSVRGHSKSWTAGPSEAGCSLAISSVMAHLVCRVVLVRTAVGEQGARG